MDWHPHGPLGRSVGLPEAWRLVSHVVNSGSAACPPPEQGRAPLCPRLARCSSLSQSMLTEWLCWSDNGLRPGCAHRATGASGHLAPFLCVAPKRKPLPSELSPFLSLTQPQRQGNLPGRSWATCLGPHCWTWGNWAEQPISPCPMAQGSGMSTGFEARNLSPSSSD